MPTEPRRAPVRRSVTVAGVLLLCLLLGACGTPSAKPGSGAAPFTDSPTLLPAAPTATPGLLEYPAESLTIHFPPSLKGDRKKVVLAYAGFQVALQRAVRTGTFGADLKRRILPQSRPVLLKELESLRQANKAVSTTAITVNRVSIKQGTAVLELCTNLAASALPTFVVMVRTAHQPYRASTIGPDKRRATC